MRSGTFARIATVTASTKRSTVGADGKADAPAVVIATLKCTPLYPLTPEVAKMVGLENFAELLITYCEGGLDIVAGDEFTSGGTARTVRAVSEWYWKPSASDRLAIVLEDPA